jgi:hypothetical protein
MTVKRRLLGANLVTLRSSNASTESGEHGVDSSRLSL